MTATTRWIGLVVFIAICLGAGGLGAIATTPEIDGCYPCSLLEFERRSVQQCGRKAFGWRYGSH
jgi:hypothetical protein